MNPINQQRIFLHDLGVTAKIGLNPEEQIDPQELLISVELEVLPAPPRNTDALVPEHAQTDDERQSVCYASLADAVQHTATQQQWRLVETLATAIVERCFADNRVLAVEVCIRKPAAVPQAKWAGVTLQARRDSSTQQSPALSHKLGR